MTSKRAAKKNELPANYVNVLDQLKTRIRSARVKASLSVNKELIGLYLDIGKHLALQEEDAGWGSSTVETLSRDLKREFPGMKGFSRSNLFYMKQMYLEYAGTSKKVQQLVGQIPWGQNLVIMSKVKSPKEREWYLRKVLENGWSRAILIHQIESSASSRQGKAITNFPKTLPQPQSEFAGSILKDPYCLEFLDIGSDIKERELELKLLDHLKEFLIELGKGFAFVGSQVHVEVGKKDFYIDLLFYHLHLRCYVVIDLKIDEFKPEYAGKMSFYLSAVDDLMKHPDDQASIGLILCKEKDRIVVEYSLRNTSRPVGVAEYQLLKKLPKKLQKELPSAKAISEELGRMEDIPGEPS